MLSTIVSRSGLVYNIRRSEKKLSKYHEIGKILM